MDPNEALSQIRLICLAILEAADEEASTEPAAYLEETAEQADRASDLADAVVGLDRWLTSKGFLPRDWQR